MWWLIMRGRVIGIRLVVNWDSSPILLAKNRLCTSVETDFHIANSGSHRR
jgi:hypothetical protein